MNVFHETIKLESCAGRVSYHNVTDQVKQIIEQSGISDGTVLVQTPHTTCSVIFEEFVHDLDFNGDEFLHVDMNRILDNIIPRELTENSNYRYPGPLHLEFLMSLNDPNYPCDPGTILNADAHIRASLFGASEQFVVKGGKPLIGEVGYIYFIDFDQNRERNRQCHVMVMGC